jgi:hypothetical protein
MDNRENPIKPQNPKDGDILPIGYESLIPAQQTLVDFKAVNGYIHAADDAVPKKTTMAELARMLNVNPDTLYEWIKKIPNFWGLVNERRKTIGSQERLAKMHHTWYLKALQGSFPHLQLWLANFDPEFRMPTQKLEHDVADSLADAMGIARNRRDKLLTAQEGEVVPDANVNG